MQFQNKPFRCFTTRSNGGLLNVLNNDIQVSEAYDPAAGGTQPHLHACVAIWDTGATATVIQKRVADALQLKPSGRILCHGVGKDGSPNEFEANTYLVNIYLPNHVGLVGVRVSEGSIGGADVLLGMDIISFGDFAITTLNGKTTWTFRVPSGEEIDFVKDLHEYNRQYQHLTNPGAKRPPIKRDSAKVNRNDPCPCGSGKKYKRCHGR